MPKSVEMDEDWRYTLLVNNTDCELIVDYIGAKYALVPKGYGVIRWKYVDHTDTVLPVLKFSTGVMELSPVFSSHDLYENKRIIIFGDLVSSSSCRTTPRTDSYPTGYDDILGPFLVTEFTVDEHLRTMGELEKEVRIWHNQCQHLLKKYQEAVERVIRVDLEFGNLSETDLESLFSDSQDPTRVLLRSISTSFSGFLGSWLEPFMWEGRALLLSCGERFYNQAAFALTSVPPWKPTFSNFALAIRELAWIVDVLCCKIERKPQSLDGWEWCEERCRLVFSDSTNRVDATEDDSLEADVRRQNADREALRSSLDLKLSNSPPGTSSSNSLNPAPWVERTVAAPVQGELESIWRKRLQVSSCASGSYSPLDAFVIDNPDTSFVQIPGSPSGSETSKSVQQYNWLGETVALSTMSNTPKVSAQAEAGFLARVQHPNVVEWMGYAFQEDLRDPSSYREFFLATEHMECDLHDLITERLTRAYGLIIDDQPPFGFFIALDIALQIVEAMVHVHRCRVIHRDLNPKNILASRKYSDSWLSYGPQILYTIKLIDFGSSKSGDDQGSEFHTRKQGTPIYMAPEVWESEESYSWSADVYSFGLTCFEIFTGKLPSKRGMPLTPANIQQVMRGEISFPGWCPEELQALIVKCWAQNPSDRPSFEEIRKESWRLRVRYLDRWA